MNVEYEIGGASVGVGDFSQCVRGSVGDEGLLCRCSVVTRQEDELGRCTGN